MSDERFQRRCKTHPRSEVLEVENYRGGRGLGLICETGHRVSCWLVVDVEAIAVVGAAQINGGLLVPGTAPALSAGPGHPCKRGHTGRWRRKSATGQGWQCGACHHMAQRAYKQRRAEAAA